MNCFPLEVIVDDEVFKIVEMLIFIAPAWLSLKDSFVSFRMTFSFCFLDKAESLWLKIGL